MENRLLEGMRNNGNIETVIVHAIDGKADAINTDGTFFSNKAFQFMWHFNDILPGTGGLFGTDDFTQTVNVTAKDFALCNNNAGKF